MSKRLDTFGWFIAIIHQALGHDKAAATLGQPPYNPNTCVLCLYERGEATRDDVIDRIGVDHA
jgi:hypothetical protein